MEKRSKVWSHGMAVAKDKCLGLLRLDENGQFFDVIVCGDRPHPLLTDLQAIISSFMASGLPGYNLHTLAPLYLCPKCLRKDLAGEEFTEFTQQEVEIQKKADCTQLHLEELSVEEVIHGQRTF